MKIILKTHIVASIIAIFIAVVALQSCKKEASALQAYQPIGNTKADSLRIFNLMPDSTKSPRSVGYAMYINDSLATTLNGRGVISPSLNAYSLPGTITIPSQGGNFVFKIAKYTYTSNVSFEIPPARPNPARVIYTSTAIAIPPHSGTNNLVFYVDATGSYNAQYIPQSAIDEAPPKPGKYKLRVVNFGYHSPYSTNPSSLPYQLNSAGKRFPVQLQYADSVLVPGLENIAFGTVTKYVQMDYGSQQFLLYNALPDSAKYIRNTYFNSMTDAFGLTPVNPSYTFFQTPYYFSYSVSGIYKPAGLNNICTYPLNAGACYTMYVFGDRSSVVLDKQYGPGDLDNFGKLQIVNANPYQQDMQVTITSSAGNIQLASIPFGKYSDQLTVPAGDVSCTFSAGGKTLYTYKGQLARLSNFSLYYISDLNGIPQVFTQSNSFGSLGVNPLVTTNPVLEQAYVSALNLSPDAGAVYYTATSKLKGNNEIAFTADDNYKSVLSATAYDARKATVITVNDLIPDAFGARLSGSRPDILANQLVATAVRADLIRSLPAAGNYTLTLAGLLNTTDPAQKLRLIMVKQSNYIARAN